jgi:hypothetical protein
VLEENPDYVLRRTAAIAARDLQLDALYYVIAHRAIHPVDMTEAQDMTHAAIDLADAQELSSFALRAAEKGGEANWTLSYAIKGRLSAEDELRILRARATQGADALPTDGERLLALLPALQLDDPGIAESVVFLAGAWRIDSEEIRSVITASQAAAARAVVELARRRAAYLFELDWIIGEVDDEHFVKSNAPASILEAKQRLEEWKRRDAE